jgi:hypothetical protein
MFFKKRDPTDDPHSIGNLLMLSGHCTEEEIFAALRFQKSNPDVLMGEHLVRIGVITEDTLEIMIAKQKAARGKNSAIIKYARLATRKAEAVAVSVDSLVGEKLK